MTTAILVDDEANLLNWLERKLHDAWPQLKIVGTAQNGRQALALAAETQPDIAFLDIQMPGLSGLQVAEALDDEIRIVFVTAHDEYAVQAFEAAAVDYLLKPVDDQRLEVTVQRLKQAEPRQDREVLSQVIQQISGSAEPRLEWLRSQRDGTTQLIPVSSVVYFRADQKYTTVVRASDEHLIRKSIKELENELDPATFWRVHRGIIVRVSEVVSARRDLRGRYTLSLRSRPEQLRSSQKYGHLFKGM